MSETTFITALKIFSFLKQMALFFLNSSVISRVFFTSNYSFCYLPICPFGFLIAPFFIRCCLFHLVENSKTDSQRIKQFGKSDLKKDIN